MPILKGIKIDNIYYDFPTMKPGGNDNDILVKDGSEDYSAKWVSVIQQSQVAELISDLASKQDKEAGKGLSTNDFTNLYKSTVDTNKNNIDEILNQLATKSFVSRYKGTIYAGDWELSAISNKYNYTLTKSVYNMNNPEVSEMLIQDGNTGNWENCDFAYKVYLNGDIRFTSDVAITCKYSIQGDK